jgi:hypothetical protein
MWLAPTPAQVVIYFILAGLTLFLSSQQFIDDLLFATGDFNPIRAGIDLVDFGLRRLIGEQLAASLSLAVFWGLVGLIVNLLWWAGSNFSTELNNNLLYSRYVHPKDVSPRAQLEDFIKRTAVRTVAAISGLLYFNYVVSTGLPTAAERYASILHTWELSADWMALLGYVALQVTMLHFVVILTRLVLLRSRVFGSA